MTPLKVYKKERTNKKKGIFILISILLPFLLLVALEGILQLAGYGDNHTLFVKNPVKGYEKFMMVNPEIGKKYFRQLEYTSPANDIFLKEKPKEAIRIFVMGSSVVYGFPYDRNLMFSRILNQRLREAFPGIKIEIVNTSITAVNSFTLLDMVDEILKWEPDAIFIYEGHNEFYGAFGIASQESSSSFRKLTLLHLKLMDVKIYQAFRNFMERIGRVISGANKQDVRGTLMKRIAQQKGILLHSDEYKMAMQNYENNFRDLLKKTSEQNVPVWISEVVSNVHDMAPFGSIGTDSLQTADEVFSIAREMEKAGELEKAKTFYYKARDLDCIRFRASSDVNETIRKITREYNASLVPMQSTFEENSPKGLIGDHLLTEHVHPNIEGAFRMAESFFQSFLHSEIIPGSDSIQSTSFSYFKRNYGYTILDSLMGHHAVQLLKGYWPFVKEGEKNYDYRKIYRPVNTLDSLAFSIIEKKNIELEDVRLELARNYQKAGNYLQAFREYNALVCMNPYLAINYRDAGTCLLQMQDLPLAFQYFNHSLEYEESFYALFRMGEIRFLMSDYNNAITYFGRAYKLAPPEKRINILLKLYPCYIYLGDLEGAKTVKSEFEKYGSGKLPEVPDRKYTFTDYIPLQTREEVLRAKLLFENNKPSEALQCIEASLEKYNSPIAQRLAGEICYKMGDFEKALCYYNNTYSLFSFDENFVKQLRILQEKIPKTQQ